MRATATRNERVHGWGFALRRGRCRLLKRVGRFSAGAGFPDAEQGVQGEELPFYKVSDMNADGNAVYMIESANTVSRATAKRLGATVFAADTIVFPKVGAALLSNKRRTLTRPSCLDNNTMGLTITCGWPKYFYYLLSCMDFGLLANPGAVPSLNESQVREIRACIPMESAQRAIADFLDRETEKIDALVAKKQRLIELLQEKRTALISHAVTKGLDPDVPMKDSGIDQLGQIPSHWMAERLAMLTDKITNGFVGPTPRHLARPRRHVSPIPAYQGESNHFRGRLLRLARVEPATRQVSLEDWGCLGRADRRHRAGRRGSPEV